MENVNTDLLKYERINRNKIKTMKLFENMMLNLPNHPNRWNLRKILKIVY